MNRILFASVVAAVLLSGLRTAVAQQQPSASTTAATPGPTPSTTQNQGPDTKSGEQPLTRKEVTGILRENRKIVSEHGIEESTLVEIGGIKQAISIRGRDTRNPILLVVHGGPASPEMLHAFTFQSPWEDYFTVVEWDQRGAGKTYAANDPAVLNGTLTVSRMAQDTVELTNYLRNRFHKQKIFLLGHSWGTILGATVAHEHPELLYAYIGVGQIVNDRRSEELGYQATVAAAQADHNQQALHDLATLAPYPGDTMTFEHIVLERKWLEYYGGLAWRRRGFDWVSDTWELSPDYSQAELDAIGAGSKLSLTQLLPQLAGFNFEDVTDFRCPIFLFTGRHDLSVSHELAAEWYQKLHAPEKKLVWFENSAHLPMLEEPGRFFFHLVTDVRPIAVRAGDAAPDNEVLSGSNGSH
jgi:pimeloyl-ACP methyl ester carboxylesterase